MKRLRNPLKALLAYTLTEIVIVMLVVAVIVAVTIGVTKHKLDSIVTYTYYSAYSALRTATSQILADYDPTDERYQANVESPTLLAKAKIFFSSNFGVLAVNAADLQPGIVDAGVSDNTNPPIESATGPGQQCCRTGGYSVYNPTAYMNNYSCVSADGPSSTLVSCMGSYCCYPKSNTNGGTGSSSGGLNPGGGLVACTINEVQCSATSKGARVVTSGTKVIYCCPKEVQEMTQCPAGSSEPGTINPLCKSGDSNAFYISAPEYSLTQGQMGKKLCCCPKNFSWNGSSCVPNEQSCEGENPYKCGFCNTITGQWQDKFCMVGQHLDESTCECVSDESATPECTGGKVWNGTACVCPEGQVEQDGTCVTPSCTGGRIWNGTECVCPEGKIWNGVTCRGLIPINPGTGCTGTAPCGKQCNLLTGSWVDIPGFSRECDPDQNKVWDETQCSCVQSSRTITLTGQKYCEYMVSLLNTKANAAECSGPSISSTLTSFSGKIPDITLRNGMRLYNVRQNPQAIAELANNIEGGKINLNGTVVDTNKWGYTVYVDIDGEKGASEKWVDVYPFYVTLSGLVIPAYDKDHPGLYGGDSRNHLQVSIEDEVIQDGRRKTKWLAKSVSYKEGACGAGYIGADTPYCKNNGAVSLKSECSIDNSLCRLKYIKPIKFLF